ncbi:hypothetical protein RHAB21_00507 [Pseudorhizobium halotolerans]|uniref:Uncharacterized protein n=1 Tax=Pseudorhizobium halotolerans TaxID=1233081 RepID=A0ABN7JXU3_9HYPH|nr:hypothetical protein RHAB21_00507 [Pseudorhizobium halotolerans]
MRLTAKRDDPGRAHLGNRRLLPGHASRNASRGYSVRRPRRGDVASAVPRLTRYRLSDMGRLHHRLRHRDHRDRFFDFCRGHQMAALRDSRGYPPRLRTVCLQQRRHQRGLFDLHRVDVRRRADCRCISALEVRAIVSMDRLLSRCEGGARQAWDRSLPIVSVIRSAILELLALLRIQRIAASPWA